MDKGRTEAFSDGVLAVAITLLVLNLRVDTSGESLWRQLAHAWPDFAAYVISFFVIGVIWVNHHALLALIDHVDRVLLFENLLLLMFVVTLPFTTSALAEFVRGGGGNARVAVLLYGISDIGMAVSFTAMLSRMVHHGLLVNPVERQAGTRAVRRFGLGTIGYPIAMLAGLVWPPLILIGIGALTGYYMLEQTPILPRTDQFAASSKQI